MRTSEIGACAWRISRAERNGTPDYDNPVGGLCIAGGITAVTHDFEIEDGDQIFTKDACGAGCVNVVRDDIEKWVNFEITICKDDYRIWEILGLASAFTDPSGAPGNVVGRGHTMAAGCTVVTRARVILELWAENYDCDELDETAPYHRHIFTKCVLTPRGYDLGSDPSLPVFAGKAFNNANISDGPFGDLDILAENDFVGAYAVVDDTALPVCPEDFDYIPIPPAAS